MILCLKNAFYGRALQFLLDYREPNVGSLEQRELFDDPLSLCHSLWNFSDDVMSML
jgi:hypothetical protein